MTAIMERWQRAQDALSGDSQADRVVPPEGFTATLTSFVAGAMAFLTVFALALSLATERLADRWATDLARTSTVRISAPEAQMTQQANAVLEILKTTPGIESARLMSKAEQRKLLEPWFGPELPLDELPVPSLIEVVETGEGPDMDGLRLRLVAEAPGAVLDDHTRWRRPLVSAASRLRLMATLSILLIAGAMTAMIVLAVKSALAANSEIIGVMRLIGARDNYIAKAFVRRFTIRTLLGAALGTVIAMSAILLLPAPAAEGAFLTGLGFQGIEWLLPLLIPPIAAVIAFWTTRMSAFRALERMA